MSEKPIIDVEQAPMAVAVREQSAGPLDVAPAAFKAGLDRRKENRKILMDWIHSGLVEGVDYGRIHVVSKDKCRLGKDCKTSWHWSKPSLFKPGAEKIAGTLGMTVNFPTLADYEQAALKGVKIENIILRCEIADASGKIVANGIGARSVSKDFGDINKSLKMACKSAMIDTVLRMGGLSEVFTQDIEDMIKEQASENEIEPVQTQPKPEPKPVPKIGTEATREWMIEQLKAGIDGTNRAIVTEYFQKSGALLPTEDIEDLPLRFVPVSKDELTRLSNCISNFEAGGDLVKAFEPHYETEAEKPIEIKSNPTPAQSQPWFNVIIPIPHKGQKREDYLRNPDTIGSLYLARHGQDDVSNEARQRLWGFVTHYAPKGWTKKDGTTMPPSDSDMKFRDMLDAFADWFEKNHPDEKL